MVLNRVHFQSQASDSYEANKAKLIKSFIKVGPASKCNPSHKHVELCTCPYIYTDHVYAMYSTLNDSEQDIRVTGSIILEEGHIRKNKIN